MKKEEKKFIVNKGLILGLSLMLFPIIDLTSGLNMSLTKYFIIFVLGWLGVYTYLVVKCSREFASYYKIFPFKDAFRVLFVISAIGIGVLTIGKTLFWTISFPEKYIEINQKRQMDIFSMRKSVIDNAYTGGAFSDDEYEEQIELYNQDQQLISDEWNRIKSDGIGITFFLQQLISVLFFIAIYCAILAFFVRKKQQFIKTN